MTKTVTLIAIYLMAILTLSAGTPGPIGTTLYSQKTISQLPGHMGAGQRSLSCDTIFNFTSDTTALYLLQPPAEGYLSGSGAVAANLPIAALGERLSDPGATGEYVTSALAFFGRTRINSADSGIMVTAYLYDTTGLSPYGGPAPGNALDSASVSLRSIAYDIAHTRATVFAFANQPVLTTDVFFITVALPQITGDTLVIYTNTLTSGSGDGWLDIPANSGWASYQNLLHKQLGDFIEVSVCSARSCPPITVAPAQIGISTSAYVSPSGGAAPYTYSWNSTPTQNTDTATSLTIGTTYQITVTDHNGCSAVAAITMTSCTTIAATATQVGSTPAAYAVATSGTAPYTYAWNSTPAQSTDTATGLTAGTAYTVTITDHNGCTGTASITIAAASCPTITVTATEIGNTASADASASGGTAPYAYSWSTTPAQATDTATALANGTTYTVTATDHNGCTGTATVSIATGIAIVEAGLSDFSIYPNPSNGVFTASIHLIAASDVSISIVDMTGSKIYESSDKAVKNIDRAINLSAIAAGVYVISVKTEKGTANQRIVIK